jgi:hypothetical protein
MADKYILCRSGDHKVRLGRPHKWRSSSPLRHQVGRVVQEERKDPLRAMDVVRLARAGVTVDALVPEASFFRTWPDRAELTRSVLGWVVEGAAPSARGLISGGTRTTGRGPHVYGHRSCWCSRTSKTLVKVSRGREGYMSGYIDSPKSWRGFCAPGPSRNPCPRTASRAQLFWAAMTRAPRWTFRRGQQW